MNKKGQAAICKNMYTNICKLKKQWAVCNFGGRLEAAYPIINQRRIFCAIFPLAEHVFLNFCLGVSFHIIQDSVRVDLAAIITCQNTYRRL